MSDTPIRVLLLNDDAREPLTIERLREAIDRKVELRQATSIEEALETIDVWSNDAADRDGDHTYIISPSSDGDVKMEVEKVMLESQQLFRTFMDNSPAVSFIKDDQGRHLFVNKQFTRLFNIKAEELVGKTDHDLYGADVANRVRKVDELVFGTGNAITAIDVFEHEGLERHWLTVKFPLRDAAGDCLVGGQAIEITERVRVEKSLRESEERFQLASRATNDAIWDRDLQTGHISWNRNVQALFHYDTNEIRNDVEWWDERIHPEDRDKVRASLAGALDGKGHFWAFEYRFRCGNGSYAYVFDRGHLVRDEKGKPVRMIGAMTDLTARKRAEEALKEAHDELELRVAERTSELLATMARLEQAHQAQQRFVADASHDLRTPLTVARCELDLLLNESEHNVATRASLERIASELIRLDDLASDLLLLATIDAYDSRISNDTISIDGIIFDCVAELRTLSVEKDIVWQVQIDEPIEANCNASMVERALINIMENAIKYSPPGGTATVTLARAGDHAMVSVADNGVGIPEHDIPRVFDRFYRGDLTRNTEGTGLGLAIVKAVVDAHGGGVDVSSKPSAGTTVRMYLPV